MNDLLKTLRHELADLEAQLRLDPRVEKIERIKALLNSYGAETMPETASGQTLTPAVTRSIRRHAAKSRRRKTSGGNTKDKRVKEVVLAYLAARGPQHRKDILNEVVRAGLMGSEKDPLQGLAIYLSRWKNEIAGLGGGRYQLASTKSSEKKSGLGGSVP